MQRVDRLLTLLAENNKLAGLLWDQEPDEMKANSLIPPSFFPRSAGPPTFRLRGSLALYKQLIKNFHEANELLSLHVELPAAAR